MSITELLNHFYFYVLRGFLKPSTYYPADVEFP